MVGMKMRASCTAREQRDAVSSTASANESGAAAAAWSPLPYSCSCGSAAGAAAAAMAGLLVGAAPLCEETECADTCGCAREVSVEARALALLPAADAWLSTASAAA